jgi:SPP1 gp7 family putative phage head morphogenesis protein
VKRIKVAKGSIARLRKTAKLLEQALIAKADRYALYAGQLRSALLANWDEQSRSAIKEALTMISKGTGNMTESEFDLIDKRLRKILGVNMEGRMDEIVMDKIVRTYNFAQGDTVATIPSFAVADQAAIDWLHENSVYWIGKHYNKQISGTTRAVAREIIRDGLDRKEAASLFKKRLGNEFKKSNAYWKSYANHVVTRAREFSHVESWVKTDTKYYQIIGVSDFRQSDICREMDGKVFPVERAVKLKRRIMRANTPEAVKDADRWYKYDEITSWKTEKLPLPMSLPPYHFGCRSTTTSFTRTERKL